MKHDSLRLRSLIDAAQGGTPVDLCLRGCRLVNVLSGRIETVDLAVHDGLFAGWGAYEAVRNIDAKGMYVCPGFIDGHIHIESSLLCPEQFCAAVIPWGTTAVVADPHEIANVLGLEGIRYMLLATENERLDVYFNLPSCVPASPLECSGATLRATDLHSLLPHPRLLGLAEMMNFPGVLCGSPDVLDKLLLFQGFRIDGHSPGLSGEKLNAYISSGISSDHECTTRGEAAEKLSRGMAIMIREGSQSKNLAELLPVVDDHTWPNCMLVSDDAHPDDLLRDGHVNCIVNRAMSLGMSPVRAIAMATLTPARHFGLAGRGAIAPGYMADFSMSPTLNPWEPVRVFKRGVEVARDGVMLGEAAKDPAPYPPSPMRLRNLRADDLRIEAQPGEIRVIGVNEGSLLTSDLPFHPKVMGGSVVCDLDRDLLKLVVCNRYAEESKPSVGFVHGMGFNRGAIASTIAHDSHNVIATGTSDEDIIAAIEALRPHKGGMSVVSGDLPALVLPLPISGLMSDKPVKDVVKTLSTLKKTAYSLGCKLNNPFLALSFLALPVIPDLKLTDLGLVDVRSFRFVSLFHPRPERIVPDSA